MKKIVILFAILIASIIPSSASYHLDNEISYVTHTTSGSDHPAREIEISKDGNDLILKYRNTPHIVPSLYDTEVRCTGYKTPNSLKLVVGVNVMIADIGMPYFIKSYANSDTNDDNTLYDIDIRIKEFNSSEFLFTTWNLGYGMEFWKSVVPIDLKDGPVTLREGDTTRNSFPDPTKLEWVLRNPKTGKIYRTRLGDKIENMPAGKNTNRIFTGRKFYLYESLEHNPETDQVIAYLGDFSGNFEYAERLAVDVEIPGDFWSSHLAGTLVNPYRVLSEMGKSYFSEQVGLTEYKITINEAEIAKMDPPKAYWTDLLQKQMRPIYAKEVKLWRENDKLLSSRIFYGEAEDHTYEAQWIHGLGPAGDNFASNLPYPVYDLPEGAVPTSLLYVRNFETNEIVWGDPTLDTEYMEAAGLAEIEDVQPDTYTVYTASGICILKDGTPAQYDSLPKGLYIVNGKKLIKK